MASAWHLPNISIASNVFSSGTFGHNLAMLSFVSLPSPLQSYFMNVFKASLHFTMPRRPSRTISLNTFIKTICLIKLLPTQYLVSGGTSGSAPVFTVGQYLFLLDCGLTGLVVSSSGLVVSCSSDPQFNHTLYKAVCTL